MRNILILLSLFTFDIVELSAQTTSSAAQVVTFGVQRMGVQASLASNLENTMSSIPLKVTVGSRSLSQDVVEFSTSTAQKSLPAKIFAMNAGVGLQRPVSAAGNQIPNISKSAITKSIPSSKPFVTFTE